MFEFFIALFGGSYYLTKGFLSSSEKNKNDEWNSQSQNTHETLKATLAEEREIVEGLKNPEERWAFLDSISEELSEIYGDSWRDEYNDINTNYISFLTNPLGIAFHVLLSKKYKVPRMFSDRYALDGLGELGMQRVIKACSIIEKNIQQRHPSLKILFVPGVNMLSKGGRTEYYTKLEQGHLYWEHNIPLRNYKWNPPIKRLW